MQEISSWRRRHHDTESERDAVSKVASRLTRECQHLQHQVSLDILSCSSASWDPQALSLFTTTLEQASCLKQHSQLSVLRAAQVAQLEAAEAAMQARLADARELADAAAQEKAKAAAELINVARQNAELTTGLAAVNKKNASLASEIYRILDERDETYKSLQVCASCLAVSMFGEGHWTPKPLQCISS